MEEDYYDEPQEGQSINGQNPVKYIPVYAVTKQNPPKNPYQIPKFPGQGYTTAGVGFSSAGIKPPDAANKAFIPFFGYIDPIVLITIVAFPVLCTLGITSLLMPVIPIVIYILGLIFPSSRKMKLKMKLQEKNKTSTLAGDVSTTSGSRHGSLVSPTSMNRVLRLLEAAMQKF